MKFPKKLRKLFALVYKGTSRRFIIKAPRGGGKSQFMAMLGFAMWFFKNRSVVDMGGSYTQAKEVYDYFEKYVRNTPGIMEKIPKDPTINYTESDNGNYFKCVTASPKQIRGPHPDILLADEVCETKDELILAAIPMVNSSDHPLIIMTSTFHKIFGIFQETWDNAEDLGYTRFSWDIFDVVREFDPKIWDNPELNRRMPDFQELKKLAKGRTGDPDGFINVENVVDAWMSKPSLEHFLVENMGTRPSAKGLVLDPIDVDNAIFDDKVESRYNYQHGAETVIGIDWGWSNMTSVVELMKYKNQEKVLLRNDNYSQTRSDIIIEDVVNIVFEHNVKVIYADSAGKFENAALQNAIYERNQETSSEERVNCKVVEVVFSKEKPSMLGNMRSHFQRSLLHIPESLKTAKWQLKRYHYQEGTEKPAKEHDHIPDSLMCALQHYQLENAKGVGFAKVQQMMDTAGEKDDASRTITGGLMDHSF